MSDENENPGQERGAWGSKLGFILAAAGSAVGLGNIWKFPYITGENGGGLFVLIYLVCILLVGLPIMVAEIMIGRAARKQPVVAFETLQGKPTGWTALGWLGVFAGFAILSFYIVVAGWAMDYAFKSVVRFTEPVYKEAETQALVHRGGESLEGLRAEILAHRAQTATRQERSRLKSQVPQYVRKECGYFRSALERITAGGASAEEIAEAKRRLLLKDELRAHVERVEANDAEIAKLLKAKSEELRPQVMAMSEPQVYDEAETLRRRDVILTEVQKVFGGVATDSWLSTFWASIIMLGSILLVAAGISGGIERTCRVLMPMLILLILVMVIYGSFQSGFGEALDFVFKPDASRLKGSGVLEALGHAFFTLSLGMGALITYGSYQKSRDDLVKQAVAIAGLDTVIALLACMMMFPIVFSYGAEPAGGPGLVFMAMPLAFAEMGAGGMLLSILFFGLLVFAAITSVISLLEVVASAFIDKLGWPRRRAVWLVGLVTLAVGLPSAFASGEEPFFPSWSAGYGKNFFDSVDYLASNWLLPIGGLLTAIYAGWVMPARIRKAELEGTSAFFVQAWVFLLRIVAPALVLLVLAQKVGFIDIDQLLDG